MSGRRGAPAFGNVAQRGFDAFWLDYLRAHARPATRWLHFLGTNLALVLVAASVFNEEPWLLALAPAAGYGPAWISHWLIERNRPESFRRPLYALGADFYLWALLWSGRLRAELVRAGVGPHA